MYGSNRLLFVQDTVLVATPDSQGSRRRNSTHATQFPTAASSTSSSRLAGRRSSHAALRQSAPSARPRGGHATTGRARGLRRPSSMRSGPTSRTAAPAPRAAHHGPDTRARPSNQTQASTFDRFTSMLGGTRSRTQRANRPAQRPSAVISLQDDDDDPDVGDFLSRLAMSGDMAGNVNVT